MNERFYEFLKEKGLTLKEVAVLLCKSEQYVRKLVTSGGSFGLEPIKAILTAFPEINTDWLITGNGDMFKTVLNIGDASANSVGNVGGYYVNLSLNDQNTEKIINKEGVVIARKIQPDEITQQKYEELLKENSELKSELSRVIGENALLTKELLTAKDKIISLLDGKG